MRAGGRIGRVKSIIIIIITTTTTTITMIIIIMINPKSYSTEGARLPFS